MRAWVINLLVSVLSLASFIGVGEVFARAFYPEFANEIHTREITGGYRLHRGEIGGVSTRIPGPNALPRIGAGDRVILVVGDSVTFGYGLPFNDTFVAAWQRRLALQGRSEKIISFGSFGNNISDNAAGIVEFAKQFEDLGATVVAVIYQFNFNDLVPATRADLQNQNSERGWVQRMRSGSQISRLRHEVLNLSVLFRVASVKAAALFANSHAQCESLGAAAMGGYTNAFIAKGQEEAGERAWAAFEASLTDLAAEKRFPFAIMISPLSVMVHPNLPEHQLAVPPRMDCATIDPAERLKAFARRLNFAVCDPTAYLRENFERYRDEGNTVPLFQENDSNHPNRLGAKFMGEFCFENLFGLAGTVLRPAG